MTSRKKRKLKQKNVVNSSNHEALAWRDIPIDKIEKGASSALHDQMNDMTEADRSEQPTPRLGLFGKRRFYNPEFRSSRFYGMSSIELIDYAGESDENRREVRNMLARNHEYYMKNGPNGLIKAIVSDVTEVRKSFEKDPFDYYGREAERIKRSEALLKGSWFAKIFYLLFWTLVVMAVVGLVLTSMGL